MQKLLTLIAAASLAVASVTATAQASIPFFGKSDEVPTLAPMLEEVTPAVVNISVKGKREVRQRLPDALRFLALTRRANKFVSGRSKGSVLASSSTQKRAMSLPITTL